MLHIDHFTASRAKDQIHSENQTCPGTIVTLELADAADAQALDEHKTDAADDHQ